MGIHSEKRRDGAVRKKRSVCKRSENNRDNAEGVTRLGAGNAV